MGRTCEAPKPVPNLLNLFDDVARQMREKADAERAYRAQVARDLVVKGAGDATGVAGNDPIQGQHFDCFLVTALAAVAGSHPDPDRWLRNAVQANADGTFTVTFYEWTMGDPLHGDPPGYHAKPVTITPEFSRPAQSNDEDEMWPAVLEKAYSQAFPDASDPEAAARDSYGFGAGSPALAMSRLTGLPSQQLEMDHMSIQDFADYRSKGFAVTATSHHDVVANPLSVPANHPSYQPGGLLQPSSSGGPQTHYAYNESLKQWHVYEVSSVNVAEGTVTLHNVWDPQREEIKMAYDDFQDAFSRVDANPVVSHERPR